jgi:hypothetical protein
MSSPLLEFSNSSILVTISSEDPEINNGRYEISGSGTRYLMRCYLGRSQGSKADSSINEAYGYGKDVFIGVEINRFLYRGYCLQYSIVSSDFQHGISSEDNLVYTDISGNSLEFFTNDISNKRISIRHGNQFIADGWIDIIGGVYGMAGIDSIVTQGIGGIPITIRGSIQI